ncbi:MAG: hypothetical protein BWY42_00887 [Candidatus Omnitrophica bacterium ADurb.Bin277]|nr:MAG: hypothetical protein BWY42_00887 [Candidatus Omnitrophica bacterium ADurb.Bin277]
MERAQTKTQDDVTVTVAVMSDRESKKAFGVSLAKKRVQPVWIAIDNQSEIPYVFIPRNIDPNYYSTEEAAFMSHFRHSRQILEAGLVAVIFFPALALIPVNFFAVRHANKKMDKVFSRHALPSHIIMPKSQESGFVFTSVDEGTKHVTVDLLGEKGHNTFSFVVTVPGMKPDHTTRDFEARYPDTTLVTYEGNEIPGYMKELPCCTTNQKGNRNGDPINLTVLGELEDVITLFTSAGWAETRALTVKSGLSMAKAFFTGDEDRYSPVSPLYHNGHPQDLALQKARSTINQRLHLRLWYTPLRWNGKPAWVGTISRDIGVKLTPKTWYFTTHKIDPNLDDARDYVLADLIEVQKVARFGFIKNTALESSDKPKKNLTGDSYFTDNRILVIELSTEDTTPKIFPWHTIRKDSPSEEFTG